MSYKLNKNLTTAFLALFIILNNAEICHAQGVVSLVEDTDPGIEDDIFLQDDLNGDLTGSDAVDLDLNLPDTLSDEDVIPLENSLISPVEPSKPAKADLAASDVEPADLPKNEVVLNPEPSLNSQSDLENEVGLPSALTPQAPLQNPLGAPVSNVEPGPLSVNTDSMGSNNLFAQPAEAPKAPQEKEKFANSVLSKIDDSLFSQMSDIEKQTTLLTLELRREKIRNEIEAIKAQRQKAIDEKIAAEEEKKRKEFEWKKEQEAKVLREQQALKEKEIELEKLKQRKMLNAYMNQMLAQNQKWIEENALLHKQMRKIEEDRKKLAMDFKNKMDNLNTQSNKAMQSAENAKSNHNRTVASLTAQNIQLKKRIEADALAAKNREANPFAVGVQDAKNANSSEMIPVNLSKEYAIMEITGKGDTLAARLINKDGDSFVVSKGSILQTGHIVDQITERYIQFDKQGLKDYIYTSGIETKKLPGTANMETDKAKADTAQVTAKKSNTPANVEKGVPSLGSGMFVK